MIPHIMVQAVLQQSVSGFYTDLVTRPTGRAVRENIERELAPGTIAVPLIHGNFIDAGTLKFRDDWRTHDDEK